LSLAVAVIVGVALVSASGAATTNTQKVIKINVSTRAAVVHYLRSIHVNPKHAVIQRGLRNYAGAHCPGKHWTCAGTRHTVVQIAKRGGQNRFACRTAKCVVVQLGGISRGRMAAARASKPQPPPSSTASCIKTTGVTQSCVINQPNATGTNKAVVWMVTPKLTGLTQSASYSASITQGPASATGSSNTNIACVTQQVSIDGSTTKTNGANITVTSDNHESITINQNSLTGGNTVEGARPSGSTYDCNGGSQMQQDEQLTSIVTSKGSITQKQDTATTNPQTGLAAANVVTDVEQNQGSGFFGFASGLNNAAFEQSTNQVAIANTTTGATVVQQQQANVPNPPYSGGVGTINQDSSALSTAVVNQTEMQCQDAVNTTKTPAQTTCDPNDPDPPTGINLTQTQYGPLGVFTPSKQSAGRVHSYRKGYGKSQQTGAASTVHDSFTLNQTSTQNADLGSGQQNLVQGDCASAGGSCETSQLVSLNSGTTQDGWSAPSIGNININCPKNQTCVPTPPPTPTFVSGPNDPNPSASAAFNFTDPATGGVHFLCKIDGTPQGCSSGVAFPQGYGPHTFQVAAADNHGNVSAYVPTTPFTWTNVPPDPTIQTHPSNPATYGTSSFTFSDAESPVHFQCQIDSQTPTPCNSGSITYSGLTVLPSGSHTFSVTAYDTTNTYHSVSAATYTWVTTPPNPTITVSSEPGNPDFFGNSYSFAFTDTDLTVHYQCQIDSDPVTSCNSGSSDTYSGLAPGSHTFSVTAYDQHDTYPSNNPATYTWKVLPLSLSTSDDGATAGWECQPGDPIALQVGTGDPYSTFAAISITDAADTAINGMQEPSFTTDNYDSGSPRYVIDLSNGDLLNGLPPNPSLGNTGMVWQINYGYPPVSWSDVQTAEHGTTVVDAYVVADGSQLLLGDNPPNTAPDNISDLTFNGTDFNPGACP
jgi:hypothetical protein